MGIILNIMVGWLLHHPTQSTLPGPPVKLFPDRLDFRSIHLRGLPSHASWVTGLLLHASWVMGLPLYASWVTGLPLHASWVMGIWDGPDVWPPMGTNRGNRSFISTGPRIGDAMVGIYM